MGRNAHVHGSDRPRPRRCHGCVSAKNLLGPPLAYYRDLTSGSHHNSIANLPIMDCELAPLPAIRDRLGNCRTDTTAIWCRITADQMAMHILVGIFRNISYMYIIFIGSARSRGSSTKRVELIESCLCFASHVSHKHNGFTNAIGKVEFGVLWKF